MMPSPSLHRPIALLATLLLLGVHTPLFAAAKESGKKDKVAATTSFQWENCVIHIEVTNKVYNYLQPWERGERKTIKNGVVVDGNQILTTADGLADQTLIRLKKQGSGLFSLGTIAWIDYQSNLALITTNEADFWSGLQPARLAALTPNSGQVRVLRWRDDQLENRQGEISSITVENSALSYVSVPALKIDSTIQGGGWAEAVVQGDKLIGLTSQEGGDALTAVPSFFIDSILKARTAKTYTGLGYFDFTWDPASNPLCLDYLKLPGKTRGVFVKQIGLKPGVESPVKPKDVLLQIDGFDIDAEGNYRDPQYGKLSLENLSSRGKWAGAECRFKLWRDGKELEVTYKLPLAAYSDELVPFQSYDRDPEYVMVGGFVFVPLTEAFLRSWGGNWRQQAPFRLSYYAQDKVKPDRPQRVVVSQILPSAINTGYESLRNTVIDEINGVRIKTLADIPVALKSPQNGFHIFKFESGEPIHLAVLDASQLDQANMEIMARYHIPIDHVLNAPAVAVNEPAAGSASKQALR